jgi:DNA-binding CsgD family transcriptional regulator
MTAQSPTLALVGRPQEHARLGALLQAGRRGPASLLLLGPAGIGKSALLDLAADTGRADGARVLRIRGSAFESTRPRSVLQQLLLPLAEDVGALTPYQRETLAPLLGVKAQSQVPDPFVLGLAVLGLLHAGAGRAPLLVIADDLQLFDPESLDLLAFAARRLDGPVTLLAAARGHSAPSQLDLPLLYLPPLNDASAVRLLDAQPQAPTGWVRLEVLRRGAGNPSAIIELAQAVAGESNRELVSRPARITSMFAGRLAAMPPATLRLLLHLAAGGPEGSVRTIATAAGVEDPLAGWVPAERDELVTVLGDRVRFTHPLLPTAVYYRAPAHARRQVHAELAAAPSQSPAGRAWHLAWHLAGGGARVDAAVAGPLEQAGDEAGLDGAHFEAARALQLSAESSPEGEDQARRYAKALSAAHRVGDPVWVQELYERVGESGTDPQPSATAAATGAAAAARSRSGQQRAAFTMCARTVRRGGLDQAAALTLTDVAAAAALASGLPEHRRQLAELVALVPPPPPDAAGFSAAVLNPGRRALTERPTVGPEPDEASLDATRLLTEGSIAWLADESDTAVRLLRPAAGPLRAQGLMPLWSGGATTLGCLLIDLGRWDEAAEVLDEVAAAAAISHSHRVEVEAGALRAWVLALQGDAAAAASALPDAWTGVDLAENRQAHAYLLRANAETASAAGDLESAYRHLRALFDPDGTPLHYFHSYRSISELANYALRTGNEQDAAPVWQGLRTQDRLTVRMALQLHHAEALLGDPRQAERHFRLALVNPEGERWPLERARARLHYAEWLRRRRRPLEARPLLASVLETFTRLGATALAGQARNELRASGISTAEAASGPPLAGPFAELTAQEEQIVRLAAAGLRNREIAEQLILSPRTIGSHLYKAYPKLGISGRHQLRDLVQAADENG